MTYTVLKAPLSSNQPTNQPGQAHAGMCLHVSTTAVVF